MQPLAFVTAPSPESAADRAREGGRYFAGGLDLLGEIRRQSAGQTLVDIKSIPGTRDIVPGPERWTIGANVTVAELLAHPGLAGAFPALAEAAALIGSARIRGVATVGGNLAQHSRCAYYRSGGPSCRKRGGDVCFARVGENKHHALLTGGPCVSPFVSNLAVALAALDARVVVLRGRRRVRLAVGRLYTAAWRDAAAHNSLGPADLILRVEIPVVEGRRSAYLQIREESEFDWALVSCAAAARVSGRTIRGVRIVLGSIAPIPWQLEEANAVLEGRLVDDDAAAAAAAVLLRKAVPLSSTGYKIPIARALIRRALQQLVA
jgi:xanthine dehydrogenase YagS FAD-binding subunit